MAKAKKLSVMPPSDEMAVTFKDGELSPDQLSTVLPDGDRGELYLGYHNRIVAMCGIRRDVDILIAHDLYMQCQYNLWEDQINPLAENGDDTFKSAEQYIDYLSQQTGRGMSTLKRNLAAYRLAVSPEVGMLPNEIVDVGMQPIVAVSQAVTSERDGTPKAFKKFSLEEGKVLGEEIKSRIVDLSSSYVDIKRDNNLRSGDLQKEKKRLLNPYEPEVWISKGESESVSPKWFRKVYNPEGEELLISGDVTYSHGDNGSFEIEFHPDKDGQLPDEVMDHVFTKLRLL